MKYSDMVKHENLNPNEALFCFCWGVNLMILWHS